MKNESAAIKARKRLVAKESTEIKAGSSKWH